MNRHLAKAVISATTAVAALTFGSAWAHLPGRFTGGGSFFCDIPYVPYTQRVTHGFELHCGTGDNPEASNPPVPNNLEINFSGGDNFHLTTLKTANCSIDGGLNSEVQHLIT